MVSRVSSALLYILQHCPLVLCRAGSAFSAYTPCVSSLHTRANGVIARSCMKLLPSDASTRIDSDVHDNNLSCPLTYWELATPYAQQRSLNEAGIFAREASPRNGRDLLSILQSGLWTTNWLLCLVAQGPKSLLFPRWSLCASWIPSRHAPGSVFEWEMGGKSGV